MATQGHLDAAPAAQASDIAQLWQRAVEDYEKQTKKSLHLAQFRSIDQIMKGTEGLSNDFKDFRHDRSKTDNVRTAFKNNLWLIQKVVNTVQVVGNAASAFPPAMPASLIFTAFGQVMQSFASVSADYDKIMGFFDFTHRFFDRLSMIEDKTPQQAPFQRCVARVFSGMLTICSVAQEYAEKKRFKKWFSSLVDGSDGALSGAIQTMEEAVNDLTQAVGLATLRTVEILDDIMQCMNGNVEFLVAQVTVIDGRLEAIQSDTGAIIAQTQALDLKQDTVLAKLDEQSRLFNDAVQSFAYVQMGANFGASFRTSLLKLDVVRLRLTRWGQSVGLANVVEGGGGGDDGKQLQMTKLAPEDQEQVQDLLAQILELFAEAEAASKRLRRRNPSLKVLDPAEELDGVSASLHRKMEDLAKKRQGKSELEQDQVTILSEEKNFARLIEDIGELVDGLVDLFPGIQEEQRKLCEEEVSGLNANEGALSLLKEVAAGQDKLLSDTVVKVIQSTTTYTNSVVFSGPNSGFQIGNNSGKISGVRFGGS
ncbi:prion-inhibition and propagation-domain-containing protein [Aspergillus carlsbadensis]|nr:prion-inhibition and propagation-domain-containing protein [Aspergillus carlsbadensis]